MVVQAISGTTSAGGVTTSIPASGGVLVSEAPASTIASIGRVASVAWSVLTSRRATSGVSETAHPAETPATVVQSQT